VQHLLPEQSRIYTKRWLGGTGHELSPFRFSAFRRRQAVSASVRQRYSLLTRSFDFHCLVNAREHRSNRFEQRSRRNYR